MRGQAPAPSRHIHGALFLVLLKSVPLAATGGNNRKCALSMGHVGALANAADRLRHPERAIRLIHITSLFCYRHKDNQQAWHTFSRLVNDTISNLTAEAATLDLDVPRPPTLTSVVRPLSLAFDDVCEKRTDLGGVGRGGHTGDPRLKDAAGSNATDYIKDGSKVLCNVKSSLQSPCHVFSVGSNGDASFETAVHELAPDCQIDTFDGTLIRHGQTELVDNLPAFLRFHPINWGRQSIGNVTQILEGVPSLSVLKIDCDGCEYETLMPFLATVCTDQVVVEVHALTLVLYAGLLTNLSEAYVPFYAEDNPRCGVTSGMRCAEISWRRRKPCNQNGLTL
jgi:hypothetical protein